MLCVVFVGENGTVHDGVTGPRERARHAQPEHSLLTGTLSHVTTATIHQQPSCSKPHPRLEYFK